MSQHIELNPLSHITIGTIGEPGDRTFFLQGGSHGDTISLVIEKVQAAALADSFESLMRELGKKHPDVVANANEEVQTDMRLREPVDPLYRVGNLGLGFNDELDLIILVAYELVPEGEDPNIVSFWATVQQVNAFIRHTRHVVRSGRPICGNCGEPIDKDGHFCPHRNGHLRYTYHS